MLEIIHASKSFDSLAVFKDINLEIKAHSIVGLAGPSGSGKSTLLRCIQGLETLTSGQITCAGTCGFMFQDFQLFPHMDVLTNLTYAPGLTDKTKAPLVKAWELLKILGIEDKALCFPGTLSGGQKQRVALARSLMMKPDVLLCDEPTSGLDFATTGEVVDLLRSVQSMGVTMVIASHDLDFLARLADRVVVLKEGQVVADVASQYLSDPRYLEQYYKV